MDGYTVEQWYNTFLFKMNIAENAKTKDEKDKALDYAVAAFEVAAYGDIELRGSVDKILKSYISSGKIKEIKPNSGELDRIKKSGEDALVVYIDKRYVGDESKKSLIAVKLLTDLVDNKNVNFYIYDVSESKVH